MSHFRCPIFTGEIVDIPDGPWRRGPATDRQMAFLQRYGLWNNSCWPRKGQAYDIIRSAKLKDQSTPGYLTSLEWEAFNTRNHNPQENNHRDRDVTQTARREELESGYLDKRAAAAREERQRKTYEQPLHYQI
ncbi:hypothetical protein AYO40_02325 [Planctomycetaceae bacterium SCGC AG-212-D15]|nr:hypothetical protein AYO40_02325 [Planctomycetaceae bacterium SCGC AG-212-D15]